MKIDRLLGIIMTLMQRDKVTAPFLAEKFEVSRRTILRDIEDIAKAGIPIVTQQGAQGGISIIDGYLIDKALFTQDELRRILAGLLGLDSVSYHHKYHTIVDKFLGTQPALVKSSHLLIDLSSFDKASLAPKIDLLDNSIETSTAISFAYHTRKGQKTVTLYPYFIVFQWSNWYVFGNEGGTERFKLYKLNRMTQLTATEQTFDLLAIPAHALQFSRYFTDDIHAVILFDPAVSYRLIEEYGPDSFYRRADGRLHFSFSFTNEDYLLEWVLRFGAAAELLEPVHLRPVIRKQLSQALAQYE